MFPNDCKFVADNDFIGASVTIAGAATTNLLTVLKAKFKSDMNYGIFIESDAVKIDVGITYTLQVTTGGGAPTVIATRLLPITDTQAFPIYDSVGLLGRGKNWIVIPITKEEISTDIRVNIVSVGATAAMDVYCGIGYIQ